MGGSHGAGDGRSLASTATGGRITHASIGGSAQGRPGGIEEVIARMDALVGIAGSAGMSTTPAGGRTS
jgi:hypothetical protein